MVEKFSSSDVRGELALELYNLSVGCLEAKSFADDALIQSLKEGTFGFHSDRPLLWLWRFSARQTKISGIDGSLSHYLTIMWQDVFRDTSKPLVVDVGSGVGALLLNLATTTNKEHSSRQISGLITTTLEQSSTRLLSTLATVLYQETTDDRVESISSAYPRKTSFATCNRTQATLCWL